MKKTSIVFKDVTLTYDMHMDKTNNLKELVLNFLSRKTFVKTANKKSNAIDSLSLEMSEGDRVGIIGLNGSGKSTILKIISGILVPPIGKVEVTGTIQPLLEIGAGFDPECTGRENIYRNGYMLGFTKKQIQAKEKEIVEFADLGDFIESPVKYYSSGMIVRLAFTIATMIEPEILLIDEMLAAGDAQFINRARKRLEDLFKIAKIIVVVSHDMDFVKSTCSKIIVLSKGKIVFTGPFDEAIKVYQQFVDKNEVV